MAASLSNRLSFNLQTHELVYEDCKKISSDKSCLFRFRAFAICLIAYPLLFVSGFLSSGVRVSNYFAEKWSQERIIKVLNNEESVNQYAQEMTASCEVQIGFLMLSARVAMKRRLVGLDNLGISIPQEETFWDTVWSSLITGKTIVEHENERWKDFSWGSFLKADFSKLPESINSSDKTDLKDLRQTQFLLTRLLKQHAILSTPEDHLEAIKTIAAMNFVKSAFTRQILEEDIFQAVISLIPLGPFFYLYFMSPKNDRLTYEGKKDFLPKETVLANYDDLVAAHNDLIKNDFVTPLIPQKIILKA